MFRFNIGYFLLSILLLGVEIFIGACMHDQIIRPYGGDFLVVILLYCVVRSFWNSTVLVTAVMVLLFSYLLEISQYFKLADHLGLKAHSLVRILLGSYFSWTDMFVYTLGILLVVRLERSIGRGRVNFNNRSSI
jgi:uncharacterized protein DUF2809